MQDSAAVMSLILTILRECIERAHSFHRTLPYAGIAQALHPLLQMSRKPTLRIQALCISTFLCKHRSLQECLETSVDLTSEDVNAFLSSVGSQFTVTETVLLIEHMVLSTNNCKTLLESGILDFLKGSLEKGSDLECRDRITTLIEKLMKPSQ